MWFIEGIISITLSLLGTSITFITKFIKSNKAKKNLLKASKIIDQIIPLMKKAEDFDNYTGAEKKEYVMTNISKLLLENKINLDNSIISDKVEELINLTKRVNYNDFKKIIFQGKE